MLEVLSFGAGVQSTTLLYMSCDGVLPKLDAAIFADTQWEPRAVYAHLERCKEKAASAGIRVIVSTAGNLRQDLLDFWHKRESADGKRHASIPAFVKNADGSRGLIRRQCTGTYKIEVVERMLRRQLLSLRDGQRWPTVPTIRQWIGISADEVQRRRKSTRPAIVFYYPLLETLTVKDGLFERGYTRNDCFAWLREHGYPEPPRSACIGCPFHSDAEWARLKTESPDEFADACEVDRLIRDFDQTRLGERGQLVGSPYLHSSLIPLEMVEFKPASDQSEGRGMVNECQGMCGV
jgi:hypothetical protein